MRRNKTKKTEKYKSFFYLLLILLLAIVPRVWELKNKPPLIVDEAANIRDIQKIVSTGKYNPFDFHWDFSKSQLVYAFPLLLNNSVGKKDILWSLRLTSVLFSLLTLIPFFYLVKSLTTKTIAFVTTLLFSYSYYYLQFSRVGWNDIIMNLSLGLYLIWFLQISSKKKRALWPAISGILAGLIFYSYRGGIIYIIIAPFYLFYLLKKEKITRNLLLKIFIIFLVSFSLVSLPWAMKIYQNQEKYNLRLNVVSIKNVGIPYHGLINKTEIYKYQIITSIKSWVFLFGGSGGREENPRYLPTEIPPVNIFVRALFFVGLLVALFQIKKTFVWLSIYALGILLGQILTVNPPNGARGLIILPTIYIFFSLGLYKIYVSTGRAKFPLVLFILLAFIYSYLDFMFYQYWMTWIKV